MDFEKKRLAALAYFEGSRLGLNEAEKLIQQVQLPKGFALRYIQGSESIFPDIAEDTWCTLDRLVREGVSNSLAFVRYEDSLYENMVLERKFDWKRVAESIVDMGKGKLTAKHAAELGRKDGLYTLIDEIIDLREELNEDYEDDGLPHHGPGVHNRAVHEITAIRIVSIKVACEMAVEMLEAFEARANPLRLTKAFSAWNEGWSKGQYKDIFRANQIRKYLTNGRHKVPASKPGPT